MALKDCPSCVVTRAELDAIAGALGASRMDGAGGWHYEAVSQLLRERDHYASACVAAMRGQDPPWLDELTSALGWQGGTAVEAIHAVKRLVDAASEDLIPLSVAARRLRVTRRWLQSEAEAGRIPCLRADGRLLCDVRAVEAALLERARRPAPEPASVDRRGDEDA